MYPRKYWSEILRELLKRDKRLISKNFMSIVVEVLTDKINRSVAIVREVVKDCGIKMADPGSVMFKFRRAQVVTIKATDADKDQLLAIALDTGAEDVIETPVYEDDIGNQAESCYKIVSSAENYLTVLAKLQEEGIVFESDNGFELLPLTTIEKKKKKQIPALA